MSNISKSPQSQVKRARPCNQSLPTLSLHQLWIIGLLLTQIDRLPEYKAVVVVEFLHRLAWYCSNNFLSIKIYRREPSKLRINSYPMTHATRMSVSIAFMAQEILRMSNISDGEVPSHPNCQLWLVDKSLDCHVIEMKSKQFAVSKGKHYLLRNERKQLINCQTKRLWGGWIIGESRLYSPKQQNCK